jgi:hypothetical protein
MAPFQRWFVDLTTLISDCLVGVAAIGAILGLWRWRREMIGKTKFELARKMTLLSYQFRDEIKKLGVYFQLWVRYQSTIMMKTKTQEKPIS